MQTWSEVKNEQKKGSLEDMVSQMLKRKRDDQKKGVDFKTAQRQEEEKKKKLERRNERAKQKKDELEEQSKDSYLNLEQFQFLQQNIEAADRRLKEQQNYIEVMEKKMIA